MTGYKILIADDDILILTTLSKGLRQAGYEVVAASSGEEAVRLGCLEAPAAILDIRMPGIQGIEAAGLLREQAGVDSIFLSAYSDRDVVESATKEGALGYLVKPVDTHQLIPTIEAALERSADLQRLQENESISPALSNAAVKSALLSASIWSVSMSPSIWPLRHCAPMHALSAAN